MRLGLFFVAGVAALAACGGGDECLKGAERCFGKHAQYCSNLWNDNYHWVEFDINCFSVPGCTCVMQGSSAACVAESAPKTCPAPRCATSTTAMAAALTIIIRGRARRCTRTTQRGALGAARCPACCSLPGHPCMAFRRRLEKGERF